MKYFLVTGRYDTGRYRAKAESANKLRKSLPRFSPNIGYITLYDYMEITEKKYRRLKHLPDAPTAK